MVLELINQITTNKYLHSLIILGIFFGISQLVVFISQRFILWLTSKTKTNIDDLIVARTNRPISIILLFIGMRLAIIPHALPAYLISIIEHGIKSIIIAIVTYIVAVIFDILIANWGQKFASKTESKFDDEIVNLFKRFSRIIISFIGIIFVLGSWGIQIGPLLASLGIAGIAVAFALQSTLGNIFGGISLIVDRSVTVDDFIRLDDGTEGRVVDIGLRSTKIRSKDGDLIIMPNGKLSDSKIYNYHKPLPSTRVTIDFGVEYGSDVDKVKKVALHEVENIKDALKDPPPRVVFQEMGEFALKFQALFWISSIERKLDAKEAAVAFIYKALSKNGIGIPFPTRTVYLKVEKSK
ncbi:mechanosensitive ion channel family protein [Candidatus Woesearchaeota archaeon]|nr:mechanosensitive ion channel family protein [Candidatus Woesearchaeota archaeon]